MHFSICWSSKIQGYQIGMCVNSIMENTYFWVDRQYTDCLNLISLWLEDVSNNFVLNVYRKSTIRIICSGFSTQRIFAIIIYISQSDHCIFKLTTSITIDLLIEIKARIFVKLCLKSKYGIGASDCNDIRVTGSLTELIYLYLPTFYFRFSLNVFNTVLSTHTTAKTDSMIFLNFKICLGLRIT